ncbi:hypothetical protein CB1_000193004 [Camelus ferus]|nr:hypothetical protein CB1_000193004 [Camelus ferus]
MGAAVHSWEQGSALVQKELEVLARGCGLRASTEKVGGGRQCILTLWIPALAQAREAVLRGELRKEQENVQNNRKLQPRSIISTSWSWKWVDFVKQRKVRLKRCLGGPGCQETSCGTLGPRRSQGSSGVDCGLATSAWSLTCGERELNTSFPAEHLDLWWVMCPLRAERLLDCLLRPMEVAHVAVPVRGGEEAWREQGLIFSILTWTRGESPRTQMGHTAEKGVPEETQAEK